MGDILSAIVFRNGYFLDSENKCNLFIKIYLFILDGGGRGRGRRRESPAD